MTGWGGNIITGVATTGMPITPGAYLSTTDGFNFYLFVLSTNATSLLYATYFGGALSREHVDGGTSRFDKKGIVYCHPSLFDLPASLSDVLSGVAVLGVGGSRAPMPAVARLRASMLPPQPSDKE